MEDWPPNDGTVPLDLTAALSAVFSFDGTKLAPGDCLGNYVLDRSLGEGGMGVVWLADQIEPVQRRVAIKLSRKRRMSGAELNLFRFECQALARMNHPAVGQIFEAGVLDDGTPYFVMEHIQGDTLANYCARDGLGLSDRVELMRQICLGVEHAHQKGLLHCDLKPSNILVTEIDGKPRPKIIDFGTARMLDRDKVQASMYGTLAYIAPEQADPAASLDTRTDVYSLGLILYELLAGDRFRKQLSTQEDLSLTELQAALAEQPPARLPVTLADGQRLSKARRLELQAIVERCLQHDPERRFGGAAALANDLDAWLGQWPVASMSASGLYRAGCFLRRNRVLSLASLAFMLVIGALLWGLAVQLNETRLQRDRAELVADMMMNTFRQADPYRYPGGSISVRELLNQSSHRLIEQPLDAATRIHLLKSLAEVQEVLEVHADAVATLERIEALKRSAQASPGQIARIRLSRARNIAYTEDIETALALVEGLIEEAGRRSDREVLISAWLLQGELLDYLSRSAEAVASLEAAERLIPPDSPTEERLQALHLRGKLDGLSDPEERVRALEEALALANRLHGEGNKISLTVMSDLAIAYSRAGLYDRAVSHGRVVVAATERHWGEDSAGLAIAIDNLGVYLQRLGGAADLQEAEALHRRARAMFQQFSGEDSWYLAVAENNLGNALSKLGEHEQAVGHFETALALIAAALGEGNARFAIISNNLARSLIVLGELDRAGQLLDQAEFILAEAFSAEHARYAVFRITKAEWLLASGRIAEARAELALAEPTILASFGNQSDEFRRLQRARIITAAGPGHSL